MDEAETIARFEVAKRRFVPKETAVTVGALLGKAATADAPPVPTAPRSYRPPAEPQAVDPMLDVPTEYAKWTLANFSASVLEAVEPFLARNVWCLYLHGNTGSRKSSLAAAIIRAIRLRHPELRPGGYGGFVASDVFRRATMDIDWGEPRILGWSVAPLICLDDVAATRTTPVVVDAITRIVSARYNHRRATIVTCNLSLDGLATATDPRIASRLGQGLVLNMGDHDWRLAE